MEEKLAEEEDLKINVDEALQLCGAMSCSGRCLEYWVVSSTSQ